MNDGYVQPSGLTRIHIDILRSIKPHTDSIGRTVEPPYNSFKLSFLAGTSWVMVNKALAWMEEHGLIWGKSLPSASSSKPIMHYDLTDKGRLLLEKIAHLTAIWDWTRWETTEEYKKTWRKNYHNQRAKRRNQMTS